MKSIWAAQRRPETARKPFIWKTAVWTGLSNPEGTVFGTYLHGIFDYGDLAAMTVSRLMRRKGIDPKNWHFDPEEHKRREYDKLADLVRNSLDMKRIYEILEAGITC